MTPKTALLAAALLACTVSMPGPRGSASAQPGVDIPQSARMEHESMLHYLNVLAERKTATGAAARNLLDVLHKHMAVEAEFVLPPLVLLPTIAAGKVTPDMRWAIPMSDRVKAEQHGKLLQLHTTITEAALALQQAAEDDGDQATVGFVRDVAGDDLNDVEVTEPTVILIGETLRSKLPPQ
jgi:hypothetical protein